MGRKAVVEMSDGVDSSVTAYPLKKQSYEVIGVTIQIWQSEIKCKVEKRGGCYGIPTVENARRVAEMLDISYYVMNFCAEFKRGVIGYFVREYRLGRTPSPCITCNRFAKREVLLGRSLLLGAEYIATGHYAQIHYLENGRYVSGLSKIATKDQTCAFYDLTQRQSPRILMPVGAHEKPEVRVIAVAAGLLVAVKPDSQEICFVPDGGHACFTDESMEEPSTVGNSVDTAGQVLRRHKGITHYTIGQQKGLRTVFGKPHYVTALRPETNEIVLGTDKEVPASKLLADDVNWMAVSPPGSRTRFRCRAKIRYDHGGASYEVPVLPGGRIQVMFPTPQHTVTPGQTVVLYMETGTVLGGRTIKK